MGEQVGQQPAVAPAAVATVGIAGVTRPGHDERLTDAAPARISRRPAGTGA